ncbi:hypothetical protein RchiOBHm_Chr6g0312511 [Rosa chinensis]|uniref:Uncharacterized protein n=1 Tax=Rosa chinensis TaxID=74649 RepID=A0A2P6Q1P4_ROSCH|nr:hypothetical protein RchiOBHm_Chr6g0312511 [Rosa chinensis]
MLRMRPFTAKSTEHGKYIRHAGSHHLLLLLQHNTRFGWSRQSRVNSFQVLVFTSQSYSSRNFRAQDELKQKLIAQDDFPWSDLLLHHPQVTKRRKR